jgi:hypothetical protein
LPHAGRVDGLQLCPYCLTLTRIEFERGLIALESYLAKWAAFDRWLVAHA